MANQNFMNWFSQPIFKEYLANPQLQEFNQMLNSCSSNQINDDDLINISNNPASMVHIDQPKFLNVDVPFFNNASNEYMYENFIAARTSPNNKRPREISNNAKTRNSYKPSFTAPTFLCKKKPKTQAALKDPKMLLHELCPSVTMNEISSVGGFKYQAEIDGKKYEALGNSKKCAKTSLALLILNEHLNFNVPTSVSSQNSNILDNVLNKYTPDQLKEKNPVSLIYELNVGKEINFDTSSTSAYKCILFTSKLDIDGTIYSAEGLSKNKAKAAAARKALLERYNIEGQITSEEQHDEEKIKELCSLVVEGVPGVSLKVLPTIKAKPPLALLHELIHEKYECTIQPFNSLKGGFTATFKYKDKEFQAWGHNKKEAKSETAKVALADYNIDFSAYQERCISATHALHSRPQPTLPPLESSTVPLLSLSLPPSPKRIKKDASKALALPSFQQQQRNSIKLPYDILPLEKADAIAKLVLDKYEDIIKTQVSRPFFNKKMIAGIVMEQGTGSEKSLELICVSNGSQCLTPQTLRTALGIGSEQQQQIQKSSGQLGSDNLQGNERSPRNSQPEYLLSYKGADFSLRDCHAEVLCRRALVRFLWLSLESAMGGRASVLERSRGEHEGSGTPARPFKLREDVSFYLYVSNFPCGSQVVASLNGYDSPFGLSGAWAASRSKRFGGPFHRKAQVAQTSETAVDPLTFLCSPKRNQGDRLWRKSISVNGSPRGHPGPKNYHAYDLTYNIIDNDKNNHNHHDPNHVLSDGNIKGEVAEVVGAKDIIKKATDSGAIKEDTHEIISQLTIVTGDEDPNDSGITKRKSSLSPQIGPLSKRVAVDEYQNVGIMSCCDKIMMWNSLGLQGEELGAYIAPVYLSGIITTSPLPLFALYRTLYGRVAAFDTSDTTYPFNSKLPALQKTSDGLSNRPLTRSIANLWARPIKSNYLAFVWFLNSSHGSNFSGILETLDSRVGMAHGETADRNEVAKTAQPADRPIKQEVIEVITIKNEEGNGNVPVKCIKLTPGSTAPVTPEPIICVKCTNCGSTNNLNPHSNRVRNSLEMIKTLRPSLLSRQAIGDVASRVRQLIGDRVTNGAGGAESYRAYKDGIKAYCEREMDIGTWACFGKPFHKLNPN